MAQDRDTALTFLPAVRIAIALTASFHESRMIGTTGVARFANTRDSRIAWCRAFNGGFWAGVTAGRRPGPAAWPFDMPDALFDAWCEKRDAVQRAERADIARGIAERRQERAEHAACCVVAAFARSLHPLTQAVAA